VKRLLLFCPHFMGYDDILINYLRKEYSVTYVDTEQFLKIARDEYQHLPVIIKGIFKFCKPIRSIYRERLLTKNSTKFLEILKGKSGYDLILAINGDGIPEIVYKDILLNNPNAEKILYIWDDYSWLFKCNHIKHFDFVSSYNIYDCNKYNFSYLPVFTENVEYPIPLKKKYDISIVASANKERIELAKELYKKYKLKYKFYIYFYCKNNEFDFFCYSAPLKYDEYQKVLSESVSILDCGRHGQKGPTTRVYDSIITKTKIITTNHSVSKYPIYGPNILHLDDKMDIPIDFINSEYADTGITPVTIDSWFGSLMRSFKKTIC
jgi:hypothetical protein